MKLLLILALTLAVSGGAVAQSFDFESVAQGYYAGSLQVTSGNQTLTITLEGYPSGSVGVYDIGAGLGRSVFGNQGPSSQIGHFAPMRFTFADPLSFITFRYGDGGGDSDSPVRVRVFNPNDDFLGEFTDTYPAGHASAKSMSISLANMKYFILASGPDPDNADSLGWDVAASKPCDPQIPEPAAALLASMGLGTISAALRRRRA